MPPPGGGPAQARRVIGPLVLAAAVVAVAGVLLTAPRVQVPGISLLAQAFQNALHVPLFIVLAHIGWLLARRLPIAWPKRAALWLLILLAVAAGTEWLQQWTGRSASMSDLLRNTAGLAAWVGGFVFVRSFHGAPMCAAAIAARTSRSPVDSTPGVAFYRRRGTWRVAGASLALAALASGCADFANTAVRYLERDAAAPLVFAPDRGFSRFFTRVSRNVNWQPGFLDVQPGGRGWTVIIDEPLPDWDRYQVLCVDWSGSGGLDVSLRIHDWAHNQDYRDRFNMHRPPWTGRRVESIPVADVSAAPRMRSLNTDAVAGIVIFGGGQVSGWLRIYRLWLATDSCDVPPGAASGGSAGAHHAAAVS